MAMGYIRFALSLNLKQCLSCYFQVEFTPNSIHKFDTHMQVNVRGWKTISLRVGGTIEPPCVDIDVVSAVSVLLKTRLLCQDLGV